MTRGRHLSWLLAGLLLVGMAMCALVVEGSVRKGRIAPPHRRSVSVIDTATNTLASKVVGIGPFPLAIAISPDGSRTYIVHN